MEDEFRVRVHVPSSAMHTVLDKLEAFTHDEGDPIAVSHDDDDIFLYAGSAESAQHAASAAADALANAGVTGEVTTARWHPIEEHWEDSSTPLPVTDADRGAEEERLREAEREESAGSGWPHWEVRIAVASFHDARALAERLRGEGLPVMRRWRFVFAGAPSEADANELAERLRDEVPEGAKLVVEANSAAVRGRRLPSNFFAFFGGLGQ